MSFDTLHQNQLLPIHHLPFQQIPAILICRNSLVRAGIRHILDGTRFTVAREPEKSSKLPAFPDASPALYIIGESYSADTLLEIVAALKAQCPWARVVVLADHLDPQTMMRALQAGVNGLCSTTMDRDALVKALELVMLGETFISSAMALTLLNGVSQPHESASNVTPGPTATNNTATKAHKLSNREAEILRCLMEGESNKAIARNLDLAEATIKVHIKAILRKIRVKNRTQAAMWATAHLSAAPDSRHVSLDGTGRV
jgi:two-component system nitrate/nitrite response regulator NarL